MHGRLFALLTLLAAPASVSAQAVPHACSVSAPATLLALHDGGDIAAAVSPRPATLWVLYSDRRDPHDAARTVSVLQAANVDGSRPELHLWESGPGDTLGPALALVRDTVLAAYAGSEPSVNLFAHPFAGGNDRNDHVASPARIGTVALAVSGHRALLAWTTADHASHTQWIGATGSATGHARTLDGRWDDLAALSGFGGTVLGTRTDASPSRLALGHASGHASAVIGPEANAPVTTVRGLTGPWGSLAVYAANGDAFVTTVGARGSAHDASLGHAAGAHGGGPAVAIGAARWGAVVAWTDAGIVMAVPVRPDGQPIGTPMPLIDPTHHERAVHLSVAGTDTGAVVVWTSTGAPGGAGTQSAALRMARLSCQ